MTGGTLLPSIDGGGGNYAGAAATPASTGSSITDDMRHLADAAPSKKFVALFFERLSDAYPDLIFRSYRAARRVFGSGLAAAQRSRDTSAGETA
jgi:hypothetical protein